MRISFIITETVLYVWGLLQSKVEQKRMKEEAKAAEHNKREDAKAEQHIRAAEVHFSFSMFVIRL